MATTEEVNKQAEDIYSASQISQTQGGTIDPVEVEAKTYEVDQPTMTVAGQMEGLLAADSPYMESARSSGETYAATRGLLNSSLAGEASQNAAIKAGNNNYRQVETIGANHFYNGLNDELLIYVSGWLNKNSL